MWNKFDSLYMIKSLAHRQCLKQQLYFYRMVESKPIMEKLTEFNKIIDDLVNIDVNLEDEDKALHLQCALRRSFENFKDTMLYGKEGIITLEEVQAALRTKELTKFKELKVDDRGEGLNVSRGEVKTEETGKARIPGQSLGRMMVAIKHSTNVLFVTIQVTSRRIVQRERAMEVVIHPFRLQVKRKVMRVLEH